MRTYPSTAELIEEPELVEEPVKTVGHRVLENVWAGVGMAAVHAVWCVAVDVPPSMMRWSFLFGLFWFGALSLVRFSKDEMAVVNMALRLEHNRRVNDMLRRQVKDTVSALEEERGKSSGLEHRIYAATSPKFKPATLAYANPVMADARLLVKLRYEDGVKVSRAYMAQKPGYDWAETRYNAAYGELGRLGIVDGARWHKLSYHEALTKLSPPVATPSPATPPPEEAVSE